ncbi:MAG: hypothetical protein O2919_04970 [Chloroflexi bacterium]|nr:hypothetical protein [Chloroflexota bacterium]
MGSRFSRDSRHRRNDPLAEAVRRIAIGRSRRAVPSPHGDVDARLAALEREVSEVRTRVNALFFTVIAAALGDLVARAVLA